MAEPKIVVTDAGTRGDEVKVTNRDGGASVIVHRDPESVRAAYEHVRKSGGAQ